MWNKQTNTLQILQQYPQPFAADTYAFSPDMSELIQERAVGNRLSNKLYWIGQAGQMEQLFPEYQRVRAPTWSPDGQTIAFVGTETYPGGDSDQFKEWAQIEGLVRHPWDLYLMDAVHHNPRIVLQEVGDPGEVKWSPQGDHLAFAGNYQGRSGIWILNVGTLHLSRIWRLRTSFDWSPDGRQMVIIIREEKEGVHILDQRTYPVIIDVPPLEE